MHCGKLMYSGVHLFLNRVVNKCKFAMFMNLLARLMLHVLPFHHFDL